MIAQQFAVGSLVRARGREWVVLPESDNDLLVLQPLGGNASEIAGVYLPLENVSSATFAPPDPALAGDARSCRLLRDAARLGFRATAGPFRSFGRIAVEPRAYQLVPLLLALQLDPVRLLIADDVGIGKTVEAGLIARELLDRGEIKRITVLCPPHLAEQWQAELRRRFHIEAEAVLPSTVKRLEAPCGAGESLFDYHPHTVVSLDFIKSERRRHEFLSACGEFVIVDEAHTCALSNDSSRQQRHRLLQELARNPDRHMVLVTATPHSGNEGAFRSLLALLNPHFETLPDDLSGPQNEPRRRELARHLVQRRRGDIHRYLNEDTPFPERVSDEGDGVGYKLSPEYSRFFLRVLRYARESVQDQQGGHFRQRVRWWSALSLLRALASSPAAAAATLRSRARNAEAVSVEEADAIGRRGVFDLIENESSEAADLAPGAIVEAAPGDSAELTGAGSGEGGTKARGEDALSENTRLLLRMAREADELRGAPDRKLQVATDELKKLLDAGFSPIVFCRFIETAGYVAEHLRAKLKGVEIESVTGELPPDQREARVLNLATATEGGRRRVLVATDCLSEGINLQGYFDAVMHYDLSWNPTRHEQREGRVDRYGQRSARVRIVTLYGTDNQIDGIVINVLLRKHKQIRKTLGISVPVPADSDDVVEAIFNGLLMHNNVSSEQMTLFEEMVDSDTKFHARWDAASEREKRSRTMFSHEGIKVEDVAREIEALRAAVGGQADVEAFTRDACRALDASISLAVPARIELNSLPEAVRETLEAGLPAAVKKAGFLKARFAPPVLAQEYLIGRTHPLVASLSSYLLESALDAESAGQAPARRCGAMRTDAVNIRTTLLLLRMRFHIITRRRDGEPNQLLAEDCALVAFRGAASQGQWLSMEEAESLLQAKPSQNIEPDIAAGAVRRILEDFDALAPALDAATQERKAALLDAHQRVRAATRSGLQYRIEPQPPDVLGLWVFLPPLKSEG